MISADCLTVKIESERLLLYPVSNEEMKLLIENEKDDELKQAYSEMLQMCMNEPENRIWHVLWNIELKDKPNIIIGNFSFKGINDGITEIGYGLKEGYCGKGYMTEALKRVCEWAVTHESVKRVEAETAPENDASQRVLLNAGFVAAGKNGAEGPRFMFE